MNRHKIFLRMINTYNAFEFLQFVPFVSLYRKLILTRSQWSNIPGNVVAPAHRYNVENWSLKSLQEPGDNFIINEEKI